MLSSENTAALRHEARALLASGWMPSPDEPKRIYPLFADMPAVMTSTGVWQVLLEIQTERNKE